jgi:hypothetical protein
MWRGGKMLEETPQKYSFRDPIDMRYRTMDCAMVTTTGVLSSFGGVPKREISCGADQS